jgi:tRNA-splicing ligase RtcB (3'-phosphate/5'-hydroxy nucleic acid ligase)
MITERGPQGGQIKMWTEGVPVEALAREQLHNIAGLPFIYKHVAVMPDVHLGKGATVGTVLPTQGAIIPAAVGVDIGCGMAAVRTNITADRLPDDLKPIRFRMETLIPVGAGSHREIPRHAERRWYGKLKTRFEQIQDKHPALQVKNSPAEQIGTLGGGNHFEELCLDQDNMLWIMLHSGSRNIGNRIGMHFIALAKQEMEKQLIHLPDKDLAYLTEHTALFDDYVEAVGWAQDYARANRDAMLEVIVRMLKEFFPDLELTAEAVNCHHNYVEKETHFGTNVWVTRKGAVRARRDDLGIIPGSMGARSFIVRGKGNAESFCSCSHGAGRVMSRTEAKRRFTLEDHRLSTEGVECRKDDGVIDETPKAYKDIEAVMAAQADLIEVVHTLKQVLCVKG